MQSAIDIHPQDFMVLMDETIGDRSIVTLLNMRKDGLSELPDGPHKGVYHLTTEVPRDPEVAAREYARDSEVEFITLHPLKP